VRGSVEGASGMGLGRVGLYSLLGVAVLLGACSGGERSAPVVTEPLEPDRAGGVDGPVVYSAYTPLKGGMTAVVQGTLELEGDCLYLTDGVRRHVILWPYGTRWDEEAQTLITAEGSRVPIGAPVTGGGGYATIDSRGLSSSSAQGRLKRCASHEGHDTLAVVSSR